MEKRLLDYFPNAGIKNIHAQASTPQGWAKLATNHVGEWDTKKNTDVLNSAGNALPGAMSFLGQAVGATKYENTASDILADAGRTYSNVAGVNYLKYNAIDANQVMSDEHKGNVNNTLGLMASGAAAGSVLGPWGAVAGGAIGAAVGLFSGGHRHALARRKLMEALLKALRTNNFNYSVATTDALRSNNAMKYGNYLDQPLYAANGLEARMSAGEMVYDPMNPQLNGIVPGSAAQGDNIPGEIGPTTNIISNKNNLSAMALPHMMMLKDAEQKELMLDARVASVKGDSAREVTQKVLAKEYNNLQAQKEEAKSNLDNIVALQREYKDAGLMPDYNGAPLHAKNGMEWGNMISGAVGGIIGLGQYLGAKRQSVKSPRTYMPNTYAPRALQELDSLRVSSLPILNEIHRQDANARYRTRTAGGLSGAQKYLANVAGTVNTQNAAAQALSNIQQHNLAYRSAAAQARLSAGAQEAQNIMQSNQWDLDYYSKAHAARQQGMQMGLYNSLNTLQQYIANANKLGMYRGMYKLYSDDLKSRKG